LTVERIDGGEVSAYLTGELGVGDDGFVGRTADLLLGLAMSGPPFECKTSALSQHERRPSEISDGVD
jgi:hypothetical protein